MAEYKVLDPSKIHWEMVEGRYEQEFNLLREEYPSCINPRVLEAYYFDSKKKKNIIASFYEDRFITGLFSYLGYGITSRDLHDGMRYKESELDFIKGRFLDAYDFHLINNNEELISVMK